MPSELQDGLPRSSRREGRDLVTCVGQRLSPRPNGWVSEGRERGPMIAAPSLSHPHSSFDEWKEEDDASTQMEAGLWYDQELCE